MANFAILSSGGDCPGLNSFIYAFTKMSLHIGHKVYGVRYGFEGLYKNDILELNEDIIASIYDDGGTILKTQNKGLFGAKFGNDEVKELDIHLLRQCEDNLRKLGVEYLIVMGGDGSLAAAKQLAEKTKIKLIFVPKTIDNDVSETDVSIGFNTAIENVKKYVENVREIAKSHERIMILEVMGRDTGWLTLYSGIASNSDIILLPEFDFDYNKLINEIERIYSEQDHIIILVGEGVNAIDGNDVYRESEDSSMVLYGGIAEKIMKDINKATNNKYSIRSNRIGHFARGGTPNYKDMLLATEFSAVAHECIKNNISSVMVISKNNKAEFVDFDKIRTVSRQIPQDHIMIDVARKLGKNFCN